MSIVHPAPTTTPDASTPSTPTPDTPTPDASTPDTATPDGGSGMVQRRFDVTGMTCSHCERAIAAELGTVPGVVTVEVDARTGIVVLGCDTEPDRAAVAAAVHDAGYDLR